MPCDHPGVLVPVLTYPGGTRGLARDLADAAQVEVRLARQQTNGDRLEAASADFHVACAARILVAKDVLAERVSLADAAARCMAAFDPAFERGLS